MQKEIKVYLKKKKGAFPVEYLIKKKVLKDTDEYSKKKMQGYVCAYIVRCVLIR